LSNPKTVAYQVSTSGAVKIHGINAPLYGSAACQTALKARIIAKQSDLFNSSRTGTKRQVFFGGLGGFDTRDSVKDDHPKLLEEVGTALAALYRETASPGTSQVAAQRGGRCNFSPWAARRSCGPIPRCGHPSLQNRGHT
jgi:uncharacterized protein (DUF1501 family)